LPIEIFPFDTFSLLQVSLNRFFPIKYDVIFFELDILPRDGASYRVKLTRLKAVISAGDHFEPVITIMLPDED
jgi:hypothetical protein